MKIFLRLLPFGLIQLMLSGCADRYSSSAYATVPLLTAYTASGAFEILDRPDISRVTIAPKSDCDRHSNTIGTNQILKSGLVSNACESRLDWLGKTLHEWLPTQPFSADYSHSPGSAYTAPLAEYFAQSGRTCQLVRGHALIEPQWEFVYNCTPQFNAAAVTWGPAGFSNALPPPR